MRRNWTLSKKGKQMELPQTFNAYFTQEITRPFNIVNICWNKQKVLARYRETNRQTELHLLLSYFFLAVTVVL